MAGDRAAGVWNPHPPGQLVGGAVEPNICHIYYDSCAQYLRCHSKKVVLQRCSACKNVVAPPCPFAWFLAQNPCNMFRGNFFAVVFCFFIVSSKQLGRHFQFSRPDHPLSTQFLESSGVLPGVGSADHDRSTGQLAAHQLPTTLPPKLY